MIYFLINVSHVTTAQGKKFSIKEEGEKYLLEMGGGESQE